MRRDDRGPDFRQWLRSHFEAPSTPWARGLHLLLAVLIVASVGISMIASQGELSAWQCNAVCYADDAFAGIFLIEYLLRLYAAPHRIRYVFSPYGIIDLLAILPVFLISMNGSSLSLRLARLLSILRLLKVIRYSGDLLVLMIAMKEAVRLLLLVVMTVLGLAVIIGNLMYYVEPDNFKSAFEGVWWALVTMSTVGYGDFVPHTLMGKLLAGLTMFLGISVFAVITAVIGAKIHQLTERRHTRCCRCGDVVPVASRFCMHCGVLLSAGEVSPAVTE